MAGAYDMLARIGADISDFSRKMSMVTQKINEVARSARGPLIGAGALLAPGAIPMVASLGAAAIAMGGSFAAAGLSIGAFGAVATTTLGSVFEAQKKAAEAQKELNAATNDKEREAALKKLEAAYAGLSDKQKEAAKSLQEFKTFWGDFAKQFENPVIDIFTKSLTGLRGIISPMAPAISETAAAFSRLIDLFNQSLNTKPVQEFFEFLGNTAYERTMNFGLMFGNVMRGVMALMIAFDPLAANIENGLVNMTASFAKWAEGLANSKGFENFINYVKTNGPVMLSIIGNLIGIISQIVVALAPFGAQVLAVVASFTAWLNTALKANPILMQISGILTGLGAAFLLLAPIIANVVTAISTFIGWLAPLFAKVDGTAKGITMLRTAFTFLTGPIGMIIAAVTALIAVFVGLWRTNEEFRNNIITIWTAIYTTISTVLTAVWTFIMQIWTQIKAFWDANQAGFMETAQVVWAAIGNIINTYLTAIMAVFQVVCPVISAIVQTTWQVIQTVISTVLGVIQGLIVTVMAVIRGDWDGAWQGIQQITTSIMSGIQNFISITMNAIQNVIQAGWNAIRSVVSSVMSAISSLISSAWSAIVSAVTSAVNNALNAVRNAFNNMVSAVSSAMSNVVSAIRNMWNSAVSFLRSIDLTSIGSNIIQGLINGIGSKAGAVVSKIQEIAGGIKERIMGAMQMHSPSRWMKNFVAGNMMKGWIIGIEGMRSKVLAMTETMSEWMQPQVPNVQLGYAAPNASASIQSGLQASAQSMSQSATSSGKPVVIENVIMMDSYEVARATTGHIDTMQGNRLAIQNYMRGDRG